jgi:hypothetical protein
VWSGQGYAHIPVTTADGTSKAYTIEPYAGPGTYYVVAFSLGPDEYEPKNGDLGGEYSDGYFPSSYNSSWSNRIGTPLPVVLDSTTPIRNGINIDLKSALSSHSISGTVTFSSAETGVLVVTARPITFGVVPGKTIFIPVTAEASKAYSISNVWDGDYYVYANLSDYGYEQNGDKGGEVNDGYMPPDMSAYGWSPTGTPEVITILGADVTSKNIPGLYSTYTSPY